ncbi:hypothetical protein EZV62_013769 [Acer yangbiense]|uniref:Leucine-rich repeat-containing N-terminal plant-type domain-containing protein n=1 Tax=Acer yangbiense TaxID=1000413 RepID=A0A5C7I132_9ROSI|nr:hypothetical protein EZV62_013769 [Acer yangbiense]
MSQKQATNCCVWRVLLVSLLAVLVVPTWGDDAETLIKFRISLSNDAALNNWDNTIPPCNWTGVRCLNGFDGPIPDVKRIGALRTLYLSYNKFSGEISDDAFTGNQFEGDIPDFRKATQLTTVDFSNNQLQGPIPPSLSRFNASSFSGNKGLCGKPLKACKSSNKKGPL